MTERDREGRERERKEEGRQIKIRGARQVRTSYKRIPRNEPMTGVMVT